MAPQGEVKVLGAWPSPFVMRPRIALNLKSVEYEFVEENPGNKSELLLKSNPVYKKIPVLIHGDKPVCESLVIVQYIDEVWKDSTSILPSDPYDRAMARFWAAYVDDKMFPTMREIVAANEDEAKAAAVALFKEGLSLLEEALVKMSKGKKFFGGDEIGYMDIAFGCYISWFKVTEIVSNVKLFDESATPHLVAWIHSFSSHPAVKDVMPETDKLMEFAKNVVFPRIRAAAAAK
ncbi:Glutathione S-transferase U17-like protein [Drosera capensis]